MSREARNFVGAGAVMSFGMAGAVGSSLQTADAVGGVVKAVRDNVNAGDVGWDVDGCFICSKYTFNFNTRQVFDGEIVINADDITRWHWEGQFFDVYVKGRKAKHRRNVGSQARSDQICQLFTELCDGTEYTPPEENLLPTYKERIHRILPGTAGRYMIRGFFLGLILGIPALLKAGVWDNLAISDFAVMVAIFAASMVWRMYYPSTDPVWATGE